MQHVSHQELAPLDQIFDLKGEEYYRLLHPEAARGKAVVLCKHSGGVENYTLDDETLLTQMPTFLDRTSYLTLNRFWGGRKAQKLAALNALYVDLDYFNILQWRGKDVGTVEAELASRLAAHNVPHPSVIVQTGRGLAAIWLINPMPTNAQPRWKGAMNALVEFLGPFGADKSCRDVSRIFRIPETINEKSKQAVRVSGGTAERYSFDRLADQIYNAVGRPGRVELEARKKQEKAGRRAKRAMPRGLSQSQRFKLILEDLLTISDTYGGVVPEGFRNTWLHFCATCLTHMKDVSDIEGKIEALAATATPGLPKSEVSAIVRQAVTKARLSGMGSVPCEGRYYYKGATIAEQLGITPDMARSLDLKQVTPESEKKRRKAEAEKQRRAAKGAVSRDEYLAANTASRTKPWQAMGIGRTKYYELKKAGKLPDTVAIASRTTQCPLLGRSPAPRRTTEAEQRYTNAHKRQTPRTERNPRSEQNGRPATGQDKTSQSACERLRRLRGVPPMGIRQAGVRRKGCNLEVEARGPPIFPLPLW
ncbi:hypothetical protein [Thalassorhabdomicrobium marinisediminis]|uniref:RepB-like DNA primase domain-containing protein n=1 Tax=Thalassorhabdomicrobium marinisediminis TaxID=2170577 RepID=A0A2T7FVE4_9RHOB|nr:hypothetical protein [Thalassorhabdomicrobium marinisediminis]PVA06160.1 hypothetical protein DC363_12720 [Thalassorhabdomicrobium marinisediminis]